MTDTLIQNTQKAEKIEKMSMAEFIRAYDQEGPFELINGEKRPIMPTGFQSTRLIFVLCVMLREYVNQRALGVICSEQTFVLTYDKAHWVTGSRQPDISFYTNARWDDYFVTQTPEGEMPIVMAPDLAIEIVSSTDSRPVVYEKAELYIADGVLLTWVIDPQRRTIRVFEGNTITLLKDGDTLRGGAVFPDFALTLTDFFNIDLVKYR